ncbi:hypothetical protein INT48_000391 [Thamnidium elegans]|uniref:Uncharacterized protein n=1 Tax=Thamnidium elegans TaxID=101142 RepID=A0A8H7SS16_9FUNG|nr:hypothetical protein INT48_000391 [Thamnidium elegans]
MSQEVPLISSPTNILTIQDVVLDSPVWRANVLHLEDQIDQFEKWIDGFIRALKNYIDALIKHNNLATTLCKRTFFSGLDDTLIDSRVAGNVINKFATTLQSTIAYRMKMASDLEDLLLNPLQQMIKYDLKSFKDSKKGFERMLDKYETQLYRYNVLSKQKEASALREDAFQMYELRKLYVRNSSDYFAKLVTFKANLQNILVECFSGALGAHVEEIDESAYACNAAKSKLQGWKQWLDESKVTCQYQINKMNSRCTELQDNYIEQVKPDRSLKRYSFPTTVISDDTTTTTIKDDDITQPKKIGNKQGYLNSRVIITGKSARPPWSRKWFFLQQGWFGTCTVTTINKEKGCITLGDRVSIKEAVTRISTGSDRRFCFEVVHPKCSYYLQAENEEEMHQWLKSIEYNMQHQVPSPAVLNSPQALLSPLIVSNVSSSPSLVAMSSSPLPSPNGEGSLTPVVSTTSSSLTALLIREGENTTDNIPQVTMQQDSNPISNQLYSWGMPWLSTGINALSNSSEEDLSNSPSLKSASAASSCATSLIVWPNKLEMDTPTPTLLHYTDDLVAGQRELRKLFANVPEDEIVIEYFSASLYRKPHDEHVDPHVCYGCMLMTCVNMIVIPLKKIKSIRLETTEFSNNMLLMIEIKSTQPFFFGLWLESAELVAERLKAVIENYDKVDIQSLFDLVRQVTYRKSKTPTSHVTTSSALYASVTPLTVQAQQQPMQTASSSTNSSSEETENISIVKEEEAVTPPAIHRGSPAQGALTAVYNASKKKRKSASSSKPAEPVEPTVPPSWPDHITKPKERVQCDCTDHLDKTESELVLPITAKQLFQLMYGTEIWKQLNQVKKYEPPSFTEWKPNDESCLERVMSYVMPVNAPMVKAKETQVIETQQILCQKEYLCYVMLVTTRTPNLPYADAFIPRIKYCITYETPTSCRLACSIGVKWIKSIFVKGIVNKAATKGMIETIEALIPVIQDEIAKDTSIDRPIKQVAEKSDGLPVPLKDNVPDNKKKKNGYTQSIVFLAFGAVYMLFMIHQVYLSRRCQSLLHQTENDASMVWRGVYLRDIQDKVTEKGAVLGHVNPSVYGLFQEARANGTTQQWKYTWFDKLHRNMADELGYSRERLGAIRYELLSTFRILNSVEYQLLEIEYWNWLSDQKLKCLNGKNMVSVCEVVNKERDA